MVGIQRTNPGGVAFTFECWWPAANKILLINVVMPKTFNKALANSVLLFLPQILRRCHIMRDVFRVFRAPLYELAITCVVNCESSNFTYQY